MGWNDQWILTGADRGDPGVLVEDLVGDRAVVLAVTVLVEVQPGELLRCQLLAGRRVGAILLEVRHDIEQVVADPARAARLSIH